MKKKNITECGLPCPHFLQRVNFYKNWFFKIHLFVNVNTWNQYNYSLKLE